MKNLIQTILLIGLITLFSGCSQKNVFNTGNFKLPNINLHSFSRFKVDPNLPIVRNIKYRASASKIILEWDRVTDKQIVGYRVLRQDDKSKEFIVINKINDSALTYYVDTNLIPNKTYTYSISCFTNDGRVSQAIYKIKAHTIYNLLPITELRAISNLPKKIKLKWHLYPKNAYISYYSILRASNTKDAKFKEVGRAKNPLAIEYIDYNIVDGASYLYKVVGITNTNIPTPPSNIVKANSKPLPLPPMNLTASIDLPRKIKLVWYDPNKYNKIVAYNIYTSLFKDTLFEKYKTVYNHFYIDDIGSDGKIIYYKVTAVDEDGLESPLPKNATMGSTKPNPSSPKITEYKLANNKVIIKWLPPQNTNIKEYIVVKKYFNKYFLPKTLKIKGDFTPLDGSHLENIFHKVVSSGYKIFVDKDIQAGKTYKYQVIGVDTDGIQTKPSRQISITIK